MKIYVQNVKSWKNFSCRVFLSFLNLLVWEIVSLCFVCCFRPSHPIIIDTWIFSFRQKWGSKQQKTNTLNSDSLVVWRQAAPEEWTNICTLSARTHRKSINNFDHVQFYLYFYIFYFFPLFFKRALGEPKAFDVFIWNCKRFLMVFL